MIELDKIRFGIVGPGNIARKFAVDIAFSERAELVAVASRSYDRALAFKQKYNIEHAFGSYQDLASSSIVDAVYIATPHNFHKEQVIQFLQAGKHVLVEKPISVNAKECKEMIDVAKQHNRLLMEAMWTRFLPVSREVKQIVESNKYGDVKDINIEFGFDFIEGLDPNGRFLSPALAGGTLLAMGVYNISYTLYYMNDRIKRITSKADITETKVDSDTSVVLTFENGVQAHLRSSMSKELRNTAQISFQNHELSFRQIWKPDLMIMDGKQYNFPLKSGGFEYQIDSFAETILNNKLENEIMDYSDTIKVMEIMDIVRDQIGLRYPFEKWLQREVTETI